MLERATWSIDHPYFGTDLDPGRAAEGWREGQQESRRPGVGRRVDGQVNHASSVFCTLPGHCRGLVGNCWTTRWSESET